MNKKIQTEGKAQLQNQHREKKADCSMDWGGEKTEVKNMKQEYCSNAIKQPLDEPQSNSRFPLNYHSGTLMLQDSSFN